MSEDKVNVADSASVARYASEAEAVAAGSIPLSATGADEASSLVAAETSRKLAQAQLERTVLVGEIKRLAEIIHQAHVELLAALEA